METQAWRSSAMLQAHEFHGSKPRFHGAPMIHTSFCATAAVSSPSSAESSGRNKIPTETIFGRYRELGSEFVAKDQVRV